MIYMVGFGNRRPNGPKWLLVDKSRILLNYSLLSKDNTLYVSTFGPTLPLSFSILFISQVLNKPTILEEKYR